MVKQITFIVLTIFVLIFVLENTEVVDVRILFWSVSMSRALMVLATFLMGIAVGWLVRRPKIKKKT